MALTLFVHSVAAQALTPQSPSPSPSHAQTLSGSDQDAIDALIDAMTRAVLAGDGQAYLELVDPISPEFVMEQTHWAADLDGHTPDVFTMTLDTPLRAITLEAGSIAPGNPAGALDAATATLTMTWKLPDGKQRHVTYPARFVKREGQWRYAGEAWISLFSTDSQNIARYLDPELAGAAARVVEVMPGVRRHVETGFNSTLDHPQVIKLYTSMRHLQQSIYLSYVAGLSGWNEPGEAIKILADPAITKGHLRRLLAHEYGHVATFTFDPHASEHMPWWSAEGVAELAAEKYTGKKSLKAVDRMVRSWAEKGQLADWNDMADFRSTPVSLYPQVYTQSHHFIGWLSEQFGREARNTWIREMAQGVPIEQATLDAFGSEFEVLDNLWRESLLTPEDDAGADDADDAEQP